MAYADQDGMSSSRLVSIVIVALLHAFLGYALVTGLAYEAVQQVKAKLNVVDVKEEEPPEEEEPPPEPEKQIEPPVVSPPPLVTTVTPPPTVRTVDTPPPAAPIVPTAAPPAPPAPPPPPVAKRPNPIPRVIPATGLIPTTIRRVLCNRNAKAPPASELRLALMVVSNLAPSPRPAAMPTLTMQPARTSSVAHVSTRHLMPMANRLREAGRAASAGRYRNDFWPGAGGVLTPGIL